MKLTSTAFTEGKSIPKKYTCQGDNVPPPLEFHDIPAAAVSLVLIMDDPDVPKTLRPDGMYDHWVVFNFLHSIADGVHGKNTAGQNKYTGPCPPDREHRYFFKLYALDTKLSLKEGATKKEVEAAMRRHILAEAVLMGRYVKS